jgi:hypothetical protein
LNPKNTAQNIRMWEQPSIRHKEHYASAEFAEVTFVRARSPSFPEQNPRASRKRMILGMFDRTGVCWAAAA